MSQSEQGINKNRYMLIPRTVIFTQREDEVLLIKASPDKKAFAGKYNGPGGHVERGEDILTSARRELLEETGLTADLWLSGIVLVDGDNETGICLFVVSGNNAQGEIKESREGTIEWVKKEALSHLPVVEDVPILIERISKMKQNDPPFLARSFYENDRLKILFSD